MEKAMTSGILIGVITIVATLTVTLMFVVPKLTDVLFTSGEEAQCKFDLLLSKTAKDVTYGFAKEMQVECKTTRKTITQNDLARYTALASQAIEKYPPNSAVAKEFPLTQEGKDKWALANIIAKDMKSCYDRGWRGELKIGEMQIYEKLFKNLGSDYLCILCTRYTFDSYTSTIPGFPIKPWLEQNVVQDRTFYDYLYKNYLNELDDASKLAFESGLANAKITFDKPLAVLYRADKQGKGHVYLRPYDDITEPESVHVIESTGPYGSTISVSYVSSGACATIVGD